MINKQSLLPSIHQEEDVNWGAVIGMMFIMSLLPPLIGLPMAIIHVTRKRNNSKTDYYAFFACIALYISAINATKQPSGDQVNYYVAYHNVPIIGFYKSLIYIYGIGYSIDPTRTNISGEFMNGIYNFLGYYLTFGRYPCFIFIYSFIEILAVLMGLYHFSTKLQKPKIPLICGALSMVFYYMYFNLMIHIQKQFLGQAIMMYVIGYYSRYGKMTIKTYTLAAMSVFTHASNILYIPFLLYKPLRSKLSRNTLLIMSLGFILFIILGPKLIGSMEVTDSNALTYSMARFSAGVGQQDSAGAMNFMHPRTLIILLPILFVLYKKLWLERNTLNVTEMFIFNILLFLTLTVLALFNQPLSQYRYFMMFYLFIPFFLPYIGNNRQSRDRIMKYITLGIVASFFIFFENIVWKYAPETDIILKSPILLLITDYY